MKNVARVFSMLLLLTLVACPQNPPVPPSGFNIELRFLPGFPTEAKAFVQAKALFWEQVITGDIADVPGVTSSTDCHFTPEQVPTPLILPPVNDVDDIVLYVGLMTTIVEPNYPEQNLSDGPGKTAAVANLCTWRTQGNNSNLPIISKIEFDPADLPNTSTPSQQLNLLADVTIHEMGHALGFGTIWPLYPGLRIATNDGSRCGDNPQFTGANAKREYAALGGTGNVPLVASKERGTCGHWAEGMFEDELMTPGTNPTQFNPLSRLTIAAMADLGYTVNYTKADEYHLSLPKATTDYSIDLVFDRNIPLAYRPYFYAAVNRWQKVIRGDVPDKQGIFNPEDGDCRIDHQSKFSGIDDIKIFVDFVPETQNSNSFKRIEPCLTRPGSFLPAIGIMQYNSPEFSRLYPLLTSPNPSDAEIAASKATSQLTHDMARVLGFGTNWVKKRLLTNLASGNQCNYNTAYIGLNAITQYRLINGTRNIPVHTGLTGTNEACEKWLTYNEFTYEIMGGGNSKSLGNGLTAPPALSAITIGAMQDLGYTVSYATADPIDLLPPPIPNCDPPLVTSGCPN